MTDEKQIVRWESAHEAQLLTQAIDPLQSHQVVIRQRNFFYMIESPVVVFFFVLGHKKCERDQKSVITLGHSNYVYHWHLVPQKKRKAANAVKYVICTSDAINTYLSISHVQSMIKTKGNFRLI